MKIICLKGGRTIDQITGQTKVRRLNSATKLDVEIVQQNGCRGKRCNYEVAKKKKRKERKYRSTSCVKCNKTILYLVDRYGPSVYGLVYVLS